MKIHAPLMLSMLLGALACSEDETPLDVGDAGRVDSGSDAGATDSGPGTDAGPLADAGPAADAGPGRDGGPNDETPLVDRPSRGSYSCTLSRDRTDHSPRLWTSGGHDTAVTSGGVAYTARVESMPPNPFEFAPSSFVISSLGLDGTFGANVELSTGDPFEISAPSLARRADGLALVFAEGTSLRFAAVDASGQVVVAARALPSGTTDYRTRVRLAAGPGGGFLVVYNVVGPQGQELRLLALDADGNAQGAAQVRTRLAGDLDPATAVAPTQDGYGILFRDQVGDQSRIFFSKVSPSGDELVARRQVSTADEAGLDSGAPAGFDPPRLALAAVAEGFLAAWTEVHREQGLDGVGGSALRVARLDHSGVLRGVPVLARSFEADVDEVEPSLVPFGDSVALLWARGAHIYICGGCVPDHRIDLLLLDPSDLTPVSNLISVTPPVMGGMLRRDVVRLGADLLLTYDLTFHVTASPGSAVFRCE